LNRRIGSSQYTDLEERPALDSHAIDEFIEWYCSEPRLALNRSGCSSVRISLEERHLAPTTINFEPCCSGESHTKLRIPDCLALNLRLAFDVSRVFDELAYVLATGLPSIKAGIY